MCVSGDGEKRIQKWVKWPGTNAGWDPLSLSLLIYIVTKIEYIYNIYTHIYIYVCIMYYCTFVRTFSNLLPTATHMHRKHFSLITFQELWRGIPPKCGIVTLFILPSLYIFPCTIVNLVLAANGKDVSLYMLYEKC